MKLFKYVGFLYNNPDKCTPILARSLEEVQRVIDAEFDKEFIDTDCLDNLHVTVYEVTKEIEIIGRHKLNFEIKRDK